MNAFNLESIKNLIDSFKELLSIVNAEFFAEHVIGRNKHEWITYRDPDKNWYSNAFFADIDEQFKDIITNKLMNNSSPVPSQLLPDRYISAILNSFEINHKDEHYDEIKHQKLLSEYVKDWKIKILKIYNRDEHIKSFTWGLLRQNTWLVFGKGIGGGKIKGTISNTRAE